MNYFMSPMETLKHSQLAITDGNPKFRRATQNMIASYLVSEKVLSNLGLTDRTGLGLIYASHFGEMSASMEYLEHLKNENFGKPILFQNSLHNSTTGFMTIELKIQGPALTVSASEKMNVSLVNAIYSLLCMTDQVLVCTSDSVPTKYLSLYQEIFPQITIAMNRSQAFLISKNKQDELTEFNLFEKKLI